MVAVIWTVFIEEIEREPKPMVPPSGISIMAQLKNGQVFSQGTQHSGVRVLSVRQELGLAVMALGYDQSDNTRANKAVEILLDDITCNLGPNEVREVVLPNETLATLCLRESVNNVSDYLVSNLVQGYSDKPEKTVGLAAILLQNNHLNCIATNDIYCFLFEGDELIPLVAPSGDPNPIGVDPSLQSEVVTLEYSPGHILIMLSVKDLDVLGLDFLRLTLSRFKDNLEMALRQITVRIRRNGSKQDPALILCSVKHAEKEN